jgi:hypothetical protein
VVQNKLLWAISEQTAAELVYRRSDANLPLLGMQSFDKKSTTTVKKADVSIAKNYLNEDEMKNASLQKKNAELLKVEEESKKDLFTVFKELGYENK